MDAYATLAQFYLLSGLNAAACTPESRAISSIDVAGSLFELPGNGFTDGDRVRFQALGAGAVLPAGLVRSTYYEAHPDGDFFTLTLNGAPVTITDDGTGVIHVLEDNAPKILAIIEIKSRYLDANAKAYKGPFTGTPPGWATDTVCKLAGLTVAMSLRTSSPSYNLDDVRKEADKAESFIARLSKGEPMADDPPDQTPKVAEMGAISWSERTDGGGERDWQNVAGGGYL